MVDTCGLWSQMDPGLNPGSATYMQCDVIHLRLGFFIYKMGLAVCTSDIIYIWANQVLQRSSDLPRAHRHLTMRAGSHPDLLTIGPELFPLSCKDVVGLGIRILCSVCESFTSKSYSKIGLTIIPVLGGLS